MVRNSNSSKLEIPEHTQQVTLGQPHTDIICKYNLYFTVHMKMSG